MALVLVLVACGPRTSNLQSLPGLHDGQSTAVDGPVTLAVVGATEPAVSTLDILVADVRDARADLVLFTGSLVRRSTESAWQSAHGQWAGVAPAFLGTPGARDRRGDGTLRGFHAVFAEQGVPDLGGNVTFSHADLVSEGVRWRVVVLDADRRALGDRWLDQLFWLPKVVSPGDYDHLLVLLNAPQATLADRPRPGRGREVSALLSVIADHASATALMAVFMGGGSANELQLPGGSFGEAHVGAGTSTAPASDLWHRGRTDLTERPEVELVDGLDNALRDELGRRVAAGLAGPLSVERASLEAFPSDVLPTRGWWRVTVSGTELEVALRIEDGRAAYREIYRIRYTRSAGWVAAEPPG